MAPARYFDSAIVNIFFSFKSPYYNTKRLNEIEIAGFGYFRKALSLEMD
jgi:hypothetical protein